MKRTPDEFEALIEQAKSWASQEKYVEALDLWQQIALQAQGAVQKIKANWWVGRCLHELDQMEQARLVFEATLSESVQQLGPRAELTQGLKRWLADTYHLLDEYALAEEFYAEVCVDYEVRYGGAHDYTLCALHWHAKNLHCLERYSEAGLLFAQIWPAMLQEYGELGDLSLEHLGWWASNRGAQGDLVGEIELEWIVLRSRMKQMPQVNPEALLWALWNLKDSLEAVQDVQGLRDWHVAWVEVGSPDLSHLLIE